MRALVVVAAAMSFVLATSVMLGMRGGFWKRWHVYLVTASYSLLCSALLFGIDLSSLPPPWLTVIAASFLVKSFAMVALLIDQHTARFDDMEWGTFQDGRGNSIARIAGAPRGQRHYDRVDHLAHHAGDAAAKASGG